MDFISAKEASEKWGISSTRIGVLARSGRIPGAKLVGKSWLIPENTHKPLDGRTKKAQNLSNVTSDYFRFPLLNNKDKNEYDPPLSEEELQLWESESLFSSCRFEEAKKALGDLPDKAVNKYVQIAALFFACNLSMNPKDSHLLSKYYGKLYRMLDEEIPHRDEMLAFLYEIDIHLGYNDYFCESFDIKTSHNYDTSAVPFMIALSTYSRCVHGHMTGLEDLELLTFELVCNLMVQHGYYIEAQLMYFNICFIQCYSNNIEKAKENLRQGLDLAINHNLFYTPAMYYFYMDNIFDQVLSDYPLDFASRVTDSANTLHDRFTGFMNSEIYSTVYSTISKGDYAYIIYAIRGIPNKQVAQLMHVSEGTVNNRYAQIYEKFNVKNKSELKKLLK